MSRSSSFINLRWAVIIGTSYLIISESGYNISALSAVFFAVFILSNLAISSLQKKYSGSPHFYAAIALTDIFLVSSAIYIFGRPSVDFYLVYFFIIMLSALGGDIRLVFIVAFTASILYALYQFKVNDVGHELPVKVVFLFIVAMFNTYLVDNLKKERLKVRSLEEEKLKLHNTMEQEKERFGELLHEVDAVMQIINKDKQVIWSSRKDEAGPTCYNFKEGICTKCCIDDAREDVLDTEKVMDLPGRKKYISILCSPMQNDNHICITHDITRFRETELELMFKRTTISFMHQLSESARNSKTLEGAFSEITASFEAMFGLDIAVLSIANDNEINIIMTRGIDKSIIPGTEKIGDSKTISGTVALTMKPVVIKDMDIFHASYASAAKNAGIVCLICVPIYSGRALFGTLTLASRSKKEIVQDHINIINSTANILGLIAASQRNT